MIEPLLNIQPAKPITDPFRSNSSDTKDLSKQIETLFLTELLKTLFEQTEFGKNKVVGSYMPFFTAELANSFAERGIGIGDFLTTPERLKNGGNLQGSVHTNHTPQRIHHLSEVPRLALSTDLSLDKGQGLKGEKNASITEIISPKTLQETPISLQLPAKGRISSNFGLRIDPFEGRLKQHNGIDIALEEGTEIKASARGKVVFSGEAKGYGKVVIVEHDGGYSTLYGHNSINIVNKGDVVEAGQVIALSGSSGRATGPHLHFELRKDGEALDPTFLFG